MGRKKEEKCLSKARQTKNKTPEFPKITASYTPAKEKENFALQDPLSQKDSIIFASLKKIYITGQPIHALEHVFSFIHSIVPLTSVRLLMSIMLQTCLNICKTEAKYRAGICLESAIRKG